MSNQLNDPMPILLTDRLSAASRSAVLRVVDADLDADDCVQHAGGTLSGSGSGHAAAALPTPARLLDSTFGPLMLRPLGPEDAVVHADFLQALGERGRRMRGFSLPAAQVMAPAQDERGALQLRLGLAEPALPPRDAVRAAGDVHMRLLGELCISIDRKHVAAEFALAVRPALHGYGLGRLLTHCLLDLCLLHRVTLVCGSVPAGSPAMLALAHGCGFQILRAADGSAQLALMLRPRGVR